MPNPLFLSVFLSLLILFHGALARSGHGQGSQQQNQCQLNKLDAREPDNRIQAEAGVIESWDHNDNQFQCTGSAVLRITIEPNGLHLPSYSNAPQLFYVVQGKGVLGVILPGCPETYEESDQESQQQLRNQGIYRQQVQQEGWPLPWPLPWPWQGRKGQKEQQEQREQQGQQGRQGQQEQREQQGQQGQQGRQGRQGQQEQQEQQGQQGRQRRQGQQGQEEQQEQQRRQRQQEQQGQQGQQQQDRHQKVRRIREGDIVAIPAGVVYWTYNDGDEELVAVNFHHVDNEENQLDQNPRRFYIAGNPEDEFNQNQVSRKQQGRQSRQGQQGRQGKRQGQQGQQGNGNNVYSGFERQFLADVLNVDEEVIEKLQGQNDNRGNIVRVEGQLDLVTPPRSQNERQQQRQQHGRGNGIEQTVCNLRLKENIGDPSRSDIFSPKAGRISTVNAYNLPILDHLGLSAERGFLYRNGIYAPHWNNNAHAVVYAISGRARVQVVDDNGNNVFDDEVREGQVLPVPQNFAVALQETDEGFEWVAFKTNARARITTLAGRLSVLRALPDQVLENAFQLSQDEVQNVKYNRRQVTLLDSTSSSSSSSSPWNIVA